MNEPINEGYFAWLYRLVDDSNSVRASRSHWALLQQLHATPFRWSVANDDNRNEDGKDLRKAFLQEFSIYEPDHQWLDLDASMLEMLIALSQRAAYESSGEPAEWFWKMMQNLELDRYTDSVFNGHIADEVEDKLEMLLFRDYNPDGVGGLFPLRNPSADQRRIELWYQLSAYLLEGEYVDNGP